MSYDQQEMAGPPFSVQELEVRALYGATHRIEPIASIDALADSPHFRRRGLTALAEQVFCVRPHRAPAS